MDDRGEGVKGTRNQTLVRKGLMRQIKTHCSTVHIKGGGDMTSALNSLELP